MRQHQSKNTKAIRMAALDTVFLQDHLSCVEATVVSLVLLENIMAKRIIILSPILHQEGGWLHANNGRGYCCMPSLRARLDLPQKLSGVVLEFSNQQWKSGQGLRANLFVMDGGSGKWIYYKDDFGSKALLATASDLLRTLLKDEGRVKATVYWRLLYDE